MKNTKVNFTLPQEIVDMIGELQDRYHLSKTAILTMALQEYYERDQKKRREQDAEK